MWCHVDPGWVSQQRLLCIVKLHPSQVASSSCKKSLMHNNKQPLPGHRRMALVVTQKMFSSTNISYKVVGLERSHKLQNAGARMLFCE